MSSVTGVELPQILAVFSEEITRQGGEVTDSVYVGSELLARSVLPQFEEARPGDRVQSGVALRATSTEVVVQPYLFRLACKNGAIRAQAKRARRLENLGQLDPGRALAVIREAVSACCAVEVFTDSMGRVREGAEADGVNIVQSSSLIFDAARRMGDLHFSRMLKRFAQSGDRTRYGLANAITSVARDTHDPGRRWDLEELGGAVLAGDIGIHPCRGPLAAQATSRCDEPATV